MNKYEPVRQGLSEKDKLHIKLKGKRKRKRGGSGPWDRKLIFEIKVNVLFKFPIILLNY